MVTEPDNWEFVQINSNYFWKMLNYQRISRKEDRKNNKKYTLSEH